MAPRAAALTLALLPGLLAWVVVGRAGFGVLVALGLLALVGGLWTLAQPLSKRLRFVAAAIAFSALPGTTAVWMSGLAGSFRPFSAGDYRQRDLDFLTLPVASEGVFDPQRPSRRIVNLDRYGAIHLRGQRVSLAELDELLTLAGDAPLLLRADRDTPAVLFGWLVDAARAAGLAEARVAASKFAGYGYTQKEAYNWRFFQALIIWIYPVVRQIWQFVSVRPMNRSLSPCTGQVLVQVCSRQNNMQRG